jgi:hypothetical protein
MKGPLKYPPELPAHKPTGRDTFESVASGEANKFGAICIGAILLKKLGGKGDILPGANTSSVEIVVSTKARLIPKL